MRNWKIMYHLYNSLFLLIACICILNFQKLMFEYFVQVWLLRFSLRVSTIEPGNRPVACCGFWGSIACGKMVERLAHSPMRAAGSTVLLQAFSARLCLFTLNTYIILSLNIFILLSYWYFNLCHLFSKSTFRITKWSMKIGEISWQILGSALLYVFGLKFKMLPW